MPVKLNANVSGPPRQVTDDELFTAVAMSLSALTRVSCEKNKPEMRNRKSCAIKFLSRQAGNALPPARQTPPQLHYACSTAPSSNRGKVKGSLSALP